MASSMARSGVVFCVAAVATAYSPHAYTKLTRVGGAVRRSPGLNRRLSGDVLHVRWPWSSQKAGDGEGEGEGEGGEKNDDITNSPVFLKKKLEVLGKELSQLDADIADAEQRKEEAWAEWGPQIEKMKEEFSGVKKRAGAARQMAETVERAGVLDQLLDVTDNFDRALMVKRGDAPGVAAIAEGYSTEVKDALAGAFEALGAVKIDEVGVAFDPSVHEAAMTAPDDEIPADHVQKVFQYGMKVGDRLIRPATVVVSEGPM